MSGADPVPVVTDIEFRVSEGGDFFGMDFRARDGAVRSIAFPMSTLPSIVSGCLWVGADAGRKRPQATLHDQVRAAAREAAGPVTQWEIVPKGGGAVLEFRIGAGLVCLELSPPALKALAVSLQAYVDQGGAVGS
jgi:hypothetical protein